MSEQPEALKLADALMEPVVLDKHAMQAAAELRRLVAENEELRAALKEAASYTRHPDYDWPVEFSRTVDAAIDAAKERP